ncbi:hypothetical protein [Solimonas marina]|uniref:Uncharacterized protein n=1 Tax=Solimonas marina TaxID=2714601 RepID=A0A969WAB0_9GAMM|nr:hypothetical protein [Solimonas marina]NKF22903.1 hypothetical protein [Solimonas marina]
MFLLMYEIRCACAWKTAPRAAESKAQALLIMIEIAPISTWLLWAFDRLGVDASWATSAPLLSLLTAPPLIFINERAFSLKSATWCAYERRFDAFGPRQKWVAALCCLMVGALLLASPVLVLP